MSGCTKVARSVAAAAAGKRGSSNTMEANPIPSKGQAGRPAIRFEISAPITANKNDNTHTPVHRATFSSGPRASPAWPNVNQAKPIGPCVHSMATHSAAVVGTPNRVWVVHPAPQAKAPICKAFARLNSTNTSHAVTGPIPACVCSVNSIQLQTPNQYAAPAA